MTDQKDRKFYQLGDNEKEFLKSDHHWLAQYDEEDDFLCGKVSNSLAPCNDSESP